MKRSRIIFIASIFVLLVSLNSFAQQSVSVRIGNVMVLDRNAGINVPSPEEVPIALNWINGTHTEDGNPENFRFKGDYYTWEEAMAGKNSDGTDICPDGWRLPTKAELLCIFPKGRTDYVTYKNNVVTVTDFIGAATCYFPMSGYSGDPSNVNGNYWSSTTNNNNTACYLSFFYGYRYCLSISKKISGLSVRCVKLIGFIT